MISILFVVNVVLVVVGITHMIFTSYVLLSLSGGLRLRGISTLLLLLSFPLSLLF